MAAASAAPSAGSVPLPTSSSSTSEPASASARTRRSMATCALKVERLAEMDCRSPMSAKNPPNAGSRVSGADRRDDAALRQRRRETDRLEEDGLAAGVGTADQQRALAGIHLQVERHHRLGSGQEQRVAAVHDPERRRRRVHLGDFPLDRDRVPRPRHQVVHRDAHLDGAPKGRQLRPQQSGQLAQHPERLALLLDLGLAQRVAQLDRLGRLDEERAGASRLVVHDAGGTVARVPPHGNDVAAAAHGDRGIGRGDVGLEASQQRVEPAKEPLPRLLHLAARGGERGARGVEQAAVGIERLLQPAIDRLVGNGTGERGGERRGRLDPPQVGVDAAGGLEHAQDGEEVRALEHAPLDPEPRERASDVGHRLGQERVAPAEQAGHLAHASELQPDPVEVERGPAAAHPRGAERAGRVRGDEIEDRLQLDRREPVGGPLRR